MNLNPNEYLFNYAYQVSNLELAYDESYVNHRIQDQLKKGILHYVTDGVKITKNVQPYVTEYRASVYVIDPDVFWQLVKQEAIKMSRYLNPRGNFE
jgi:hypothetical protein